MPGTRAGMSLVTKVKHVSLPRAPRLSQRGASNARRDIRYTSLTLSRMSAPYPHTTAPDLRWLFLLVGILCTGGPALIAQDTTRIRRALDVADSLFVLQPRPTLDLLATLAPLMPTPRPGSGSTGSTTTVPPTSAWGGMDSVEWYHRRRSGNPPGRRERPARARALANLGTAYRARGELDSAAAVYERALEVFESRPDSFPAVRSATASDSSTTPGASTPPPCGCTWRPSISSKDSGTPARWPS